MDTPQPPIRFVQGDATAPQGNGIKIVAHICNDLGVWGKGFVLALSQRWIDPEQAFKRWYRERETNDFAIGAIQLIQMEVDIWVANMVAQHGIRTANGVPPIRYESLNGCLEKLASKATELNASVHMPRIGCGLAGGEWTKIEPIISRNLCERGICVTVYDLDK
jgi:O-acetyl-ADP-ribose deacetylase (regulator of RNase III)